MDKLERKIGRFAVHNLMIYLIIFYVAGFFIDLVNPDFYVNWLSLNAAAICRGQIWRIVTFLIAPPSDNILWLALLSFIYYQLGTSLERMWGTFRFNLYIVIGVIGCVLAALIIYFFWGQVYLLQADNIYLSMLLAFAVTVPDMQFYLYFVIPIKAKWLGIFYGVLFVLELIQSNGPGRVAIAMSLLNFFVFYFSNRHPARQVHQAKRRHDYAKKIHVAKKSSVYPGGARHRCAVCGRTELDDPNLEFRYCSRCEGNYEYCMDHLYTHVHVTKDHPHPEMKKEDGAG